MNRDFDFSKETKTNTVRLRLLTNGIIHYTYLPNSEINTQEHQINHDTLLKFTDNKKDLLLLIDADEFINVTADGRKHIRALEPLVSIKARALVITALSQRILANFYIKIQKPIVTSKIFNNYESALAWLNELNS